MGLLFKIWNEQYLEIPLIGLIHDTAELILRECMTNNFEFLAVEEFHERVSEGITSEIDLINSKDSDFGTLSEEDLELIWVGGVTRVIHSETIKRWLCIPIKSYVRT